MTAPSLTPFDGHEVETSKVIITKAGDGLSDALAVRPQEWHHGEKVHVVIECVVTKVRFDPVKDSDSLVRVHVLSAEAATVVNRNLVAKALDDQRRAIEKAQGIARLPNMDVD